MLSRVRSRAWIACMAVLQFALPGVLCSADAMLARESARAVAHLESGSGTTCPRVHAEECALCSVVGRAAMRSSGVSVTMAPVVVVGERPAFALAHIAGSASVRASSRAPPAV